RAIIGNKCSLRIAGSEARAGVSTSSEADSSNRSHAFLIRPAGRKPREKRTRGLIELSFPASGESLRLVRRYTGTGGPFCSEASQTLRPLASFPCLDDSTNHENGRRTVALRYGLCEPCCGTEIVLRLERLLRQ